MKNQLSQQAEALLTKKQTILKMGGEAAIQKQHDGGKLTARERINILFDPATFVEIGALGTSAAVSDEVSDKNTPADAVITGWGQINGRKALVIAYDFTVIAGTIGEVGERKSARIRQIALSERIPLIWLLDSAGARIQEIASSRFAETGVMFYDQVTLSGVVPQVAALMGPCAAGTAYIAALADFLPMVKGTSSMALAGPPLVKAVIGEDISAEDLGGSSIHCQVSGVGDVEYPDDKSCLAAIRKYLSYFPSDNSEKPPRVTKKAGSLNSAQLAKAMSGDTTSNHRLDDDILSIIPDDIKKAYDMRKIISRLVDEGDFFEIKPQFGQGLITALAHFDGYPTGIVASQPMYKGGVIDLDEADKAARFINLCNAYNIPLVFLQDVPGFMVGSAVEKKGIIRHGAKFLYAVSRASVPKITLLIRKAYGAGYYVMGGRAFGADLVAAWPSAEVSLMGAEGAVNIICRKEIEKAANPEEKRKELIEIYKNKISLDLAAGGGFIDDVIDPRDSRTLIIETLSRTRHKQVLAPAKKHGVEPV